jgi:phosphoribosylformylglycinamidine synthase subunit PurL
VGLLKTAHPVPNRFRKSGLAIFLLGGFGQPDLVRFGGTEYAKNVLHGLWGLPPALDFAYEKRVQAAMRELARRGFADTAHDLSDGGLGVAIAETSFSGIGAKIEVDTSERPELFLFHEAPSRILVASAHPNDVKRIAQEFQVECPRIGATMKERLQIRNGAVTWIDCGVEQLREPWEMSLPRLLHPETHA